MRFPIRFGQTLLALSLMAAALLPTAAQAQLAANAPQVAGGETLTLTLTLPAARSDSGYLATAIGNTFYFFDEQGVPSPYQPGKITPRRLASGSKGGQTVLSLPIPAGINMALTFYSVFGKAGVDLLANGNFDPISLYGTTVQLVASKATTTPSSGKLLYVQYCADCHGNNPLSNIDRVLLGRDAGTTSRAIQNNRGGMGYLSTLTGSEVQAIADYINKPN